MAKKKNEDKITVDGIEYDTTSLSEEAKAQVLNIQFVELQLQQLRNELTVCDTARIGYSNALKKELEASQNK